MAVGSVVPAGRGSVDGYADADAQTEFVLVVVVTCPPLSKILLFL